MKQIQIKIYPFLSITGVEDLAQELTVLILRYCEKKGIQLTKKPKVVIRL